MRIEQVDFTNENVYKFIVKYETEMYIELNPNFKDIYEDPMYKEYVENMILKESLITKKSKIYAAFNDDEIIGTAVINNDNYIPSIHVDKKYRRKGIATELLKKIIDTMEDGQIIKLDARINVIDLYKNLNFKLASGVRNAAFVPMEMEVNHGKCKDNSNMWKS